MFLVFIFKKKELINRRKILEKFSVWYNRSNELLQVNFEFIYIFINILEHFSK